MFPLQRSKTELASDHIRMFATVATVEEGSNGALENERADESSAPLEKGASCGA